MNTNRIIFQGLGVRGIQDRIKTQTRRFVKPQPLHRSNLNRVREGAAYFCDGDHPKHHRCEEHEYSVTCPYGKPGDLLWVRETALPDFPKEFSYYDWSWREVPDEYRTPEHVLYRANWNGDEIVGWKPSIHMPRWASRLTLEVTDVRVERVRSISEDDAAAEGLTVFNEDGNLWYSGVTSDPETWATEPWKWHIDPRDAFCELWDSINFDRGYGWASDPWVWVIEFRAIHDNVDNVLRHREAS